MGRRHLSVASVLAVAVLAAAPAGAGVRLEAGVPGVARATVVRAASGPRWRELARGAAVGPAPSTPAAFVALDRASTKRFASRLPAAGQSALARLDLGRNAAIAIFSQFGCKDDRVAVTGMTQRGRVLVVSLVERPLAPGTMECQALYPTYRLLAVPKASLARPYPTRSEARFG